MSKKKLQTFLERLGLIEPVEVVHVLPDDVVGIATTEDYVDDAGIVQQRIVFKTDYTPSKQLKVSDFCLHNLIAAGLDPKLNAHEVHLGQSTLDQADHITESINNLNS